MVSRAKAQMQRVPQEDESPFHRGELATARVTEAALVRVGHPKKRAFLAAFARCSIVLEGCEAAGVSRQTVEYWKVHDAEFYKLFEHAKEDAADRLEAHAVWRATHAKKPSDLLVIFMLKAMRPMKFRDNVSISGHDGGPLFRMVAGVSPATVCGIETKPKPKALLQDAKSKVSEDVKS